MLNSTSRKFITDCTNRTINLQLILMTVLQCLFESLSQILRKNVEKRVLMDNLDIVMLILDEICDNGLVLTSPRNISNISYPNERLVFPQNHFRSRFRFVGTKSSPKDGRYSARRTNRSPGKFTYSQFTIRHSSRSFRVLMNRNCQYN